MVELASTHLYNDANLQEYYKLEDTSGKNGNTLTNNNSVAFNAAKFNNGADLGSSDGNKCLSIASVLGYTNGAYAVSLWVKINTDIPINTTYDLVNIYTTTSQWLFNYANNGGTKRVEFTRYDGANLEGPTYNVDLGTSAFHHLVMTHDGTSIRGYLDGILVGGPTTATDQTGGYAAGTVIGGQINDLTANNALAIFDDVAFFNRNLTADEVLTLYNGFSASLSPSASQSPSSSASSSVSASASSSASKSASASTSASASSSASSSASKSLSPSGSQSPSGSVSASISPSSSASPSNSPSNSPSLSPSGSRSPSASLSQSSSASASPSPAEYVNTYSSVGNSYTDKYISSL